MTDAVAHLLETEIAARLLAELVRNAESMADINESELIAQIKHILEHLAMTVCLLFPGKSKEAQSDILMHSTCSLEMARLYCSMHNLKQSISENENKNLEGKKNPSA